MAKAPDTVPDPVPDQDPQQGGSFTRQPDGALLPTPEQENK